MPNITPRRAAAAALLIATGLALAPEARAGGVPVTLPIVDNSPGTNFTLSGPTDVAQFKINATAGKDLFVGVDTYTYLNLEVFDPNGKLVRSYPINGNTDDTAEEGVELHPTVTGTYTARVAGDSDGSIGYPTDASIWVYPDCRGGPATKCAIAPGQTAKASLGGSNDDDAYVVKATAGKRYIANLEVANRDETLYFSQLNLVDGKGEVVQTVLTGAHADRRNKATMKFVLPASDGPFYLQVEPTPASAYKFRGTFTLSLQQQ